MYHAVMNTKPFLPVELDRGTVARQRAKSFIDAIVLRAQSGESSTDAIHRAEMTDLGLARVIKGSISALGTSDASALAAYNNAAVGFLETLRNVGCFDRMLPDMRQAPMKTRFAISTSAVVASEVEEGRGTVVARLVLNGSDPLTPRKVGVVVIASKELLRLSEAGALINVELQAGVAAGTDYAFLHDLYNASTPIASSGNAVTDIAAMLNEIRLGTTSRPWFVFHPDGLKTFSLELANGVPAFPQLTAVGGSILGVQVLTSDQLPSDVGLIVDAAAIASAPGSLEVDVSTQADIEMANVTTIRSVGGTPVAANLVSLFTTNSVGFRGTRYFSFKVLRDNAVASLSGINY